MVLRFILKLKMVLKVIKNKIKFIIAVWFLIIIKMVIMFVLKGYFYVLMF